MMKRQAVSVGNVNLSIEQDKYLHFKFEGVAEQNGDKTAIQNADNPSINLTFDQLNKAANKLARGLLKRLQVKDDANNLLVAVRFDPNVDLIISLLAILKSGLSYLPISPDWPEDRIEYLVKDAKPLCILSNKSDFSADHFQAPIIQFESLQQSVKELDDGNLGQAGTESFAVMYTSGSSGLPKGVKLLHKSIFQRVNWQWRLLPFRTAQDVCAFKAAITFIDAVSEIYSALLSGHTLAIFPTPMVKDVTKFVQGKV